MIRLKAIVLFVFIATLSNCNSNRSFETKLANGNYKFWDFWDPLAPKKKLKGFCFTNDHKCYLYKYSREGKRYKFDFGDMHIPETWMKIEDNRIVLLADTINVNYISVDTLKIYNYPYMKESILIKSEDQNFEHLY